MFNDKVLKFNPPPALLHRSGSRILERERKERERGSEYIHIIFLQRRLIYFPPHGGAFMGVPKQEGLLTSLDPPGSAPFHSRPSQ